jgi:hypothetical protein
MELSPPTLVQASAAAAVDTELAFYRAVLETLAASDVPFMVGGAYALSLGSGVERPTKDLDLFLRRDDYPRASAVIEARGWRTELRHPHWLGKIHGDGHVVDLIFSSGNGLAEVDDVWFDHASPAEVLGVPVRLVPVEETLWSKMFVMERERFDGADVIHLLRVHAATLDWPRMLERVGPHWRVLLAHLVLFGFVYPSERDRVPVGLMDELVGRLREETNAPAPMDALCQGTLLSREQYLVDVEREGYRDGRVQPAGTMTPEEVAAWTEAIPSRGGTVPPSG